MQMVIYEMSLYVTGLVYILSYKLLMLRHQEKWAVGICSNGCLTIEIEFEFHYNSLNHSLMCVSIRIEKSIFSHPLQEQVFPILFFIEYIYMPTIKVRINEILYSTTRENGYGSLLYSC